MGFSRGLGILENPTSPLCTCDGGDMWRSSELGVLLFRV